jgi:hypothetical protein
VPPKLAFILRRVLMVIYDIYFNRMSLGEESSILMFERRRVNAVAFRGEKGVR